MRRWVRWLGVVAAAMIGCRGAVAHPAVRCAAQLKVSSDGHATLSVRFDVLSFVLNEEPSKASDEAIWELVRGPTSELDEALASAGPRLHRHTLIRAEGQDVSTKLLTFPTDAEFERWKLDVRRSDGNPKLPWIGEAEIAWEFKSGERGELPETATIQFPEVLGDFVLLIELPKDEMRALSLKAGQSEEISLSPLGRREIRPRLDFVSFVRMGVEHIVPQGLDHMLFILGLFLASPRVKSLLVMVTMFTLAHSVTLALAATGFVIAPPRLIEPLIALSIVAVAIENIVTRPKAVSPEEPPVFSPWHDAVRAAIVFAFGLVHGLGFASAFKEMELPRGLLVPALVGFNVGVEVGQLLVLSCAFVLIGWAGRKSWYRGVVAVPGSAAIACVGLYWAVTRGIG